VGEISSEYVVKSSVTRLSTKNAWALYARRRSHRAPGRLRPAGLDAMAVTPLGRTHRALRCLAEKPAGFAVLMAASRTETETTKKAKYRLKKVLHHLVAFGYAVDHHTHYALTEAGERLCEELEAMASGVPSVRVFARAA